MGDVVIEPYREAWQDGVVGLILPIQRGEFGVPITAADQPDLADIPDYYQRGCGNFWVAVSGDDVVGSVALLDIGDGCVALRKMFVKQDYRGPAANVSGSLLATAQQWAQEHSVRSIFLGTTSKYHAAHRFYEKNGFVRIDKSTLPPAFPIMKVDTIFYELVVPTGR